MTAVTIRAMEPADGATVLASYQAGVDGGNASLDVDPTAHGRGIRRALIHALIASTEAAGIWTIQSRLRPRDAHLGGCS